MDEGYKDATDVFDVDWARLADAPGTETTVRIPADFAELLFSGDATGIYHTTVR